MIRSRKDAKWIRISKSHFCIFHFSLRYLRLCVTKFSHQDAKFAKKKKMALNPCNYLVLPEGKDLNKKHHPLPFI